MNTEKNADTFNNEFKISSLFDDDLLDHQEQENRLKESLVFPVVAILAVVACWVLAVYLKGAML